jgi:hypothetical protein
MANSILKEKNNVERLTTYFKTYYKPKITKTMWNWQNNRQYVNRTEYIA